jgi:hypothetical protein
MVLDVFKLGWWTPLAPSGNWKSRSVNWILQILKWNAINVLELFELDDALSDVLSSTYKCDKEKNSDFIL